MKSEVLDLLSFYSALGRPLTIMEIWRLSPEFRKTGSLAGLLRTLKSLESRKKIFREDGFYALSDDFSMKRREQDLLLDLKWKKLAKLSRWFRFLPFVDFVVVNGSLALGTVSPSSDFDVLVGIEEGRIFTARYFVLFLFSILGARRLDDSEGKGPDKLCFNHFVTKKSFKSPPFNYYRRELYKTMIPVCGDEEKILEFVKANQWSGMSENALFHSKYSASGGSLVRVFLEKILGGWFGDFVEGVFGSIAKRRLSNYVKRKKGGRVAITDDLLEFHFNLSGEEKFVHLKV